MRLAALAEDVRGDDLTLVFPDMRQLPDAGHVTDRPQPLAGAHPRIDRDAAGFRGDSDGVKPDPLHTRPSSGRHQQMIPPQLPSILQLQDEVLTLARGRDRRHPEHELDPIPTQRLPQRLTQRRRLPPEHLLARLDERHLATQTTHDLSKLDTSRPTSEHDQPPGDDLHAGRLVRAPDPVELPQTRNRGNDPIGTIGKDDVVRAIAHAIDLNHPCPREAAATAQQGDPPVRQPPCRPAIGVAGDHEVAPIQRRLHIDLSSGARLPRAMHRLPRTQQRLRRDTRPVGAQATDEITLDHRNPQTALSDRGGAVLSGRPATQDDDVILSAHDGSSSPACSRTMYSAYQSGQSGSSRPIRASWSPCAAAARRSACDRSPVRRTTSPRDRPARAVVR